nr:hypothetical protein [Tanacetum cinerariifolium]
MAAPGGANQIARHVINDRIEFSWETSVDGYMSFFKSQQIVESRGFINRLPPGGANQIARHVINDRIEFSWETSVDGYMSFFKSQQIVESRGFINRLCKEAYTVRNLVRSGEFVTSLLGFMTIILASVSVKFRSVVRLQGRNEMLEKIIGCVVDSGGVPELDPKVSDIWGIMKTEANDLDHLVNYDNDNDVDDLGFESKVYLDDEEEEDENNHSHGNVVKKGITRLSKFRKEYGKPDGIKLSVIFDALNRISGKHRALFLSFLGDLRYYDVDLTVRKRVMNRLGQLLRNFIRKLRQTYILPNQNTLSKLNEVPLKYSAIVKAKKWVNFVKYTTTEEYKVKSATSKMARSKSVYQHTMGRGGYAHVKEKIIKNKEIELDEEPPRGIMWLKGRVNKDGEFPDDEIRSVGDTLKETEDNIKEGTLKVDHGTDAMTIVLGKEKGGYARGVGSGITYKRYFDLPQSRQASDERIVLLQSQLDNERRERDQLKSLPTQLKPPDVSLVDINPIDSSADKEGGTPVVGCENDASIQKSNGLATLKKEMETRIERDRDIEETINSVVSKKTTRSIRKATPPSTIQMIDENKTAPKLQTKRKNVYVPCDAMQKQVRKKSQKSLNY